jgi:hypothetical protein
LLSVEPTFSLTCLSAGLGFLIVQRVNGGVIHQPGAHHDHPDHRPRHLSRPPAAAILIKIEAGCGNWPTTTSATDPDAIHWGHVGDLGRVDQALDDLLAIFDGQAK